MRLYAKYLIFYQFMYNTLIACLIANEIKRIFKSLRILLTMRCSRVCNVLQFYSHGGKFSTVKM